jgi:hypothetical protein
MSLLTELFKGAHRADRLYYHRLLTRKTVMRVVSGRTIVKTYQPFFTEWVLANSILLNYSSKHRYIKL